MSNTNSKAYVAHVLPHYGRYGVQGVDLIIPNGPAIWCSSRLKAKIVASRYGFELYSERAKTTAQKTKTTIYGALYNSDPDFGPLTYRTVRRKY